MTHLNLIDSIHINNYSVVPKYVQLANAIVNAINGKIVKAGNILPTINELSFKIGLARDTVEKGYKVLKDRNIILSKKGVGYFVAECDVYELRIAFFLNKFSYHKKEVYETFVRELNAPAEIDLFVYNSDVHYFHHVLKSQFKPYDYYVVFPYFLDHSDVVEEVLALLPKDKVIFLGKSVVGMQDSFATIYENHEVDIYAALQKTLGKIRKYKYLKLLFPDQSDYPKSIIKGFYKFCQDFSFDFSLVEDLELESVIQNVCYVVIRDEDLVSLLDFAKEHDYELGREVGVISYNESPLKKHMSKGITTISTDFKMMGTLAAGCINEKKGRRMAVPFHITLRNSI